MRHLFRAGWRVFAAWMWKHAMRKSDKWLKRARWWNKQAKGGK